MNSIYHNITTEATHTQPFEFHQVLLLHLDPRCFPFDLDSEQVYNIHNYVL